MSAPVVEAVAKPAAVKPVKPIKKATIKPKKPAAHPKYTAMITAALGSLNERGGSSRQAILKYIMSQYNIVNQHLKLALRAGAKNGTLKQAKGTGASGSFRLGKNEKGSSNKTVRRKPSIAKAKTSKKTKTPKKATSRKPAAKKLKSTAKPSKATKSKTIRKPKAAKQKTSVKKLAKKA